MSDLVRRGRGPVRLSVNARLRSSPKSFSLRARDPGLVAHQVQTDARRRLSAAGQLTAWWIAPLVLLVLGAISGTWWAWLIALASVGAAVVATIGVRNRHRPWIAQGGAGFTAVAGVQAWDFLLRGGPWRGERVAELRALIGDDTPLWFTRPGRSLDGGVWISPGLSSTDDPLGVQRLAARASAVATVLWRSDGEPSTTTAAGAPALALVLDAIEHHAPPPAIAAADQATQAAEELIRLDQLSRAELAGYRRRIVTRINRALDDTLAYQRALLAERDDSLGQLEQGPRSRVERLLGLDD